MGSGSACRLVGGEYDPLDLVCAVERKKGEQQNRRGAIGRCDNASMRAESVGIDFRDNERDRFAKCGTRVDHKAFGPWDPLFRYRRSRGEKREVRFFECALFQSLDFDRVRMKKDRFSDRARRGKTPEAVYRK